MDALGRDDAELAQMGPDGIGDLRELTDLMGGVEHGYWSNPETQDNRKSFPAGSARRLGLLGRLFETFEDGDEILPGVKARASFGHTLGHMSFDLAGGGVFVVRDAIGNGHLSFARPGWPAAADQDPILAAETRLGLMRELAERQVPMIGFHLPYGGLGKVVRQEGFYRFMPLQP